MFRRTVWHKAVLRFGRKWRSDIRQQIIDSFAIESSQRESWRRRQTNESNRNLVRIVLHAVDRFRNDLPNATKLNPALFTVKSFSSPQSPAPTQQENGGQFSAMSDMRSPICLRRFRKTMLTNTMLLPNFDGSWNRPEHQTMLLRERDRNRDSLEPAMDLVVMVS